MTDEKNKDKQVIITEDNYISQKYLDKCFENVQLKFNNLGTTLEKIEKHLEKQNGSIGELRTESDKRAIVVEDFRHLETDFKCVKEKVEKLDKDLLEVWFFKKYPKIFIGVIVVALISALILVRTKVSTLNETVHVLDKKVDLINVPMRTRGGGVVLVPSGIYLDSINKNKK